MHIYILFYISGAKLSRGRSGGSSPLPYLENRKNNSDFGKNFPTIPKKPPLLQKIPGYIYIYKLIYCSSIMRQCIYIYI